MLNTIFIQYSITLCSYKANNQSSNKIYKFISIPILFYMYISLLHNFIFYKILLQNNYNFKCKIIDNTI